MNFPVFISLLFALQFIYWAVGRFSSRNLQSREEYFLAGRKVSLFPLMMTFLATQVGGGVVLGAADEASKYGWPVLFYPLGVALGLIFLGAGVGRRLANLGLSTVAEVFEKVYGSSGLKKIASALSIISLFMVLVAQIIGSNKFLVSLGLNNTLVFVLFWAIVIFYTSQGGLKAVISTDVLQASFFSIVFLFCMAFVIFKNPSALALKLPALADCAPLSSKLTGWLLMPLLFMVIEQDMGQRCFAAANGKTVSRASLLAGLLTLIVCSVPLFFGILARSQAIEVPEGGSVLMTAITATTTPLISALIGCAILAAVISTATSLINAISSNLLSDFALKGSLRSVKGITCAISLAALGCSFYFDSIVDMLIQSYELSISCLFVPIFLALYRKKGEFLAALGAMIAGALSFILFRIYQTQIPREILSILLSFAGYGCGLVAARYQLSSSRLS